MAQQGRSLKKNSAVMYPHNFKKSKHIQYYLPQQQLADTVKSIGAYKCLTPKDCLPHYECHLART